MKNIPLITQKKISWYQVTNDLWVRRPSLDTEIGLGKKFTEHELVQDKYLGNLRPYEHFWQMYKQDNLGKNNQEQLGQLY